jgi:hypothetical protein
MGLGDGGGATEYKGHRLSPSLAIRCKRDVQFIR